MHDDPELRRDPVTGRWVVIAPGRAARPITLTGAEPRSRSDSRPGDPCPFCPGAEHDTPNEVLAFRAPGTAPNAPGWRLRVVPNMYPAVRPNVGAARPAVTPGPLGGRDPDDGGSYRPPRIAPGAPPLFNSAPAAGFAEVLIECPEHVDNPALLTDDQFRDVLRAYRDRIVALSADPRLAYVAVFKNVGAEAGASLGHTHSQIIALPVVPALLRAELGGAEAHYARTDRCVFCEIVEQELADGSRVVARTANFVAVTAYAPRFAYEMWVLPTRHEARYEALADGAAGELAGLMKRVLRALDAVQHAPAYNWFLHTTPLHQDEPPYYHWHLEVMPRTARPAGLEWGHGCHITTIAPERAASELRSALPG